MATKAVRRKSSADASFRIVDVSQKTAMKERLWLKGKRQELDVYQVPIEYLYFNIENGRYADKMIQLREDNPNVEIDPKEERWKNEIWKMLKGEFSGTEADREAFDLLKQDILARNQLRPGVVLIDGGVLDGNRRFAVLRDLYQTEKNPTRFKYFDAVILPEDVGQEDRWRIEAGLQIGKSEKLDYSPLNRLLKIKEGTVLFKNSKDPAQEIANTLIGISKKEVEWDIEKIKLIDSYLEFIKKPRAYNLLSQFRVTERFEEALSVIQTAKKTKLPPGKLLPLKLKLFAAIRFETMDNWQMRDLKLALAGKGKGARYKNDKAVERFIKVPKTTEEFREALVTGDPKSDVAETETKVAEKFLDEMSATKAVDEPARLAERAHTDLSQLRDTLKDGNLTDHKGWEKTIKPLPNTLREVIKLAQDCIREAEKLNKKWNKPTVN